VLRLRRIRFCYYIQDPVERQNAITSLIDGSLYSVMAGLTGPFWGAFAVRLGASDYMLGLLSSLPALIGLISQIPSALLIDKYPNRQKPTLVYSMVHRCFYFFFAVLALAPVPAHLKAWAFIIAFSVMNFPATAAGIAWTAMMGEMFEPRSRARIFGERNMVCTFVSLVSTVLAGSFLDHVGWPWNYGFLYLVSYGFVFGSWIYLRKLKETPLGSDERSKVPAGLRAFKVALLDTSFLRFILAVFAIHVGLHLPAALWTILWVKVMGLSNTWLGLFSTAAGVMSFLSFRKWGEWSEKKGNLWVLIITGGAHIIFPLIYAHFRSPYVYLVLNALGGFFGAGFGLSIFNALLDVSPDASRPTYIAIYNTLIGMSGFIWPLAGIYLYEAVGLNAVLDISFAVRILGMVVAGWVIGKGLSAEVSSKETCRASPDEH